MLRAITVPFAPMCMISVQIRCNHYQCCLLSALKGVGLRSKLSLCLFRTIIALVFPAFKSKPYKMGGVHVKFYSYEKGGGGGKRFSHT